MIRALAAMMGTAILGSVTWLVTAGASVASAGTRLRSGTLHAQLVSHVASGTSGSNGVASGLTLRGSGVMAAVVAALAVFALAFLVVTFIRRRVTAV
jgi:hypothetical protein